MSLYGEGDSLYLTISLCLSVCSERRGKRREEGRRRKEEEGGGNDICLVSLYY
jgi:hypothetical protein